MVVSWLMKSGGNGSDHLVDNGIAGLLAMVQAVKKQWQAALHFLSYMKHCY